MTRVMQFQDLIRMLKEIDLDKNDKETVRYVLNFIASELENYIDDIR